jgi:hypothetical protein
MRNPEKVLKILIGVLLLCGLGCTVVGDTLEQPLAASLGQWLLIIAVLLAICPLMLYIAVLIIENIRPQ